MRLPDLRTADLRLITEMSTDMLACRDTIQLEEFVHGNLRRLVDGDVFVWCLITLDATMPYGSSSPQFGRDFWEKIAPVIAHCLKEHPIVHAMQKDQPDWYTARGSDLPTYRPFLRSTLYNEGYCGWDCHYFCDGAIRAGNDSYLIIQINRGSREYSTRDLQAFQKLIPQMAAAYNLLQQREQLDMVLADRMQPDESGEHFWLTLGPLLYIKNSSVNARQILQEVFPDQISVVDLPLDLRRKLKPLITNWRPGIDQAKQFHLTRREERISFQLEQTDPVTFKLTGFLPERTQSPPSSHLTVASTSNLSPRELDVLGWVLEGKNNPEIGILLGIRPKTVEGHLRSIYEKLGLHSRMELMRVVGY